MVATAAMAQGLTAFNSPIPHASWDSEGYKGRLAFVRTLNDAGIPLTVQQMLIEKAGVDFIIRDMKSGHSPQLSQPEKLSEILLELAGIFEGQ